MDIGSHILSRTPGARPTSYKDIPRLLEKNKIIPADFATHSLTKMAGYRNRMVHFYGEIKERWSRKKSASPFDRSTGSRLRVNGVT